jgi:hypothetical protein
MMESDSGAILCEVVAADGELSSVEVLSQSEFLASGAIAALRQWRFILGSRAGRDTDSAGIAVG